MTYQAIVMMPCRLGGLAAGARLPSLLAAHSGHTDDGDFGVQCRDRRTNFIFKHGSLIADLTRLVARGRHVGAAPARSLRGEHADGHHGRGWQQQDVL